ncbi:MAG: hypothetical protein AAFV26_08160, partial [Pseudomonadota bacterium]
SALAHQVIHLVARGALGKCMCAVIKQLDGRPQKLSGRRPRQRAARNEMDDLMSKGRGSTPNEPA